MIKLGVFYLLLTVAGQVPPPSPSGDAAKKSADRAQRERLLSAHASEAAQYTIFRDSAQKEPAKLEGEPVYSWTNPVRGQQAGVVFIWTWKGRPGAIGCFFSYPEAGVRKLWHELHSLSLGVLNVQRAGAHAQSWAPSKPGFALAPVPGAPAPDATAQRRLFQMREISRDFSASTKDRENRRWELRMLQQPLYRYQSTDPEVLDGALFGIVTSAGTDLEVIVTIEARTPKGAAAPVWQYGIARFTDLDLWVRYKGQEVFTAPLLPFRVHQDDSTNRYRLFYDRDMAAIKEDAQ
jgi:hypothetical protein